MGRVRRAVGEHRSWLAGGEWVDGVNALRVGGLSAEVLGATPGAASTVGTFLRAFTAGCRTIESHAVSYLNGNGVYVDGNRTQDVYSLRPGGSGTSSCFPCIDYFLGQF